MVLYLGGSIEVVSKTGEGTIFTILLPCSDETVKEGESQKKIRAGRGTVLLVDDEELMRFTGTEMLSDMGYNVLTAKDGSDAVEVFRKKTDEIDFIIMDMIMPVMSWEKAFLKMREIGPGCKVIIASGYVQDVAIDQMKKQGLCGFLQKPFRNHQLSHFLGAVRK